MRKIQKENKFFFSLSKIIQLPRKSRQLLQTEGERISEIHFIPKLRLYTKRTVPFVYYISVHLKNIYESGELKKEGTIEEFSVVRLSNCRLLQQKNDSQIISLEVVANCDNFGDVRAQLEIPSITIGGKYLMGYLEFCGYFTPVLDGIANLIYEFGGFLMWTRLPRSIEDISRCWRRTASVCIR